MAVVNVSQVVVKPGRMADQIELAKLSVPLLEKVGAKNPRCFNVLAGGMSSGGFVLLTWEVDDMEEYGKVTKALYSDLDMLEFISKAMSDDSPSASYTQTILQEVDLR